MTERLREILGNFHRYSTDHLSALCFGLSEETAYDALVAKGYARLTTLHSYWLLIALEEDPELKALYRKGYQGWDGTFRREHNPLYDFAYLLSCPDRTVDTEKLTDWFRRFHVTRLTSSVSVSERYDVPLRRRFGGMEETSWLLPPDEHYITKYDRNPYAYGGWSSLRVVESCYPYTCAYWLGRYYGIIIS